MPKENSNESKVRKLASELAISAMASPSWTEYEAEALAEYCLTLAQALLDIELD